MKNRKLFKLTLYVCSMEKEFESPPQKEGHSIKLSKGQKGTYAWEIKIAGEDENNILERIKKVDDKLTKTYIELNNMEVK